MKMDREDKIFNILITFLPILILIFAIYSYSQPTYYICTDEQGNQVICIDINSEKGTYWGITEDGTHIKITSYKRMEK